MSSNQEFYRGFWTNWAMGHVRGATLTLSRRDGAYLIAFLALFVHVAGASFWRLASLVIFRSKARPNLDDSLTRQQQAVLRNSPSAISGLRGFIKISIRSRKLGRNLSLIVWAAVNFSGFLAAGILSSKVTSTQSDVLLKPIRCGPWWDPVKVVTSERQLVDNDLAMGAVNHLQALSCKKASTCYGGDHRISNSCNNPGRRALSWKSSVSPTCPFGDLCIDKTLSLESGFLDSDLDLGINSDPKDRISLRLGLQCAPLEQKDYMKMYSGGNVSSLFNSKSGLGPEKIFGEQTRDFGYEAFFYGPTWLEDDLWSPATFIFNNGTIARSMSQESDESYPTVSLNLATAEIDSDGWVVFAWGYAGEWSPVHSLVLPNRRVSLLFLSIGPWTVAEPVKDPWFKNDQPFYEGDTKFRGKQVNDTYYHRQPYTTVLGCTSKSEICHGTSDENRQCVHIRSDGRTHKAKTVTQALGLSQRQSRIEKRLSAAYRYGNLEHLVTNSGGPGLVAAQYLSQFTSAISPIPNDQWMREVQNWFASVLVMLESFTQSYVTGMPNTNFNDQIDPFSKEDEWMCHNQIVQSTDYASFSVVGLCVILFVGGAVVILNSLDERLCRLFLPKTELNEYRQSSWEKNELLALEAAAFHSGESKASSRNTSFDDSEDPKIPQSAARRESGSRV